MKHLEKTPRELSLDVMNSDEAHGESLRIP